MRKLPFNQSLLAISLGSLLLIGCASTPKESTKFNALEQKIERLRAVPGQPQYAPIAVEEAQEALKKLREMDEKGEAYQHQLYLTEKQIEIAEELVTTEEAQQVVNNAEVRRKDILLEAKTQEVEEAKSLAAGIAMRAQELEQQVEELKTEETDRGLVLTLGSVLFETNKSSLRSGAIRTVEKVANFLNEYPDRNILIEGFTDSEGSETYNKDLSLKRAQAVRDQLVSYGVENRRITTEGYGEEFPVANNSTAAGRQQNRRVEIVIAKSSVSDVTSRTSMR